MPTLQIITAKQLIKYSWAAEFFAGQPMMSVEDAERLAQQYNATWAGCTWRIENGCLVYSK